MPDRAAFIATICERRDDDGPRLVFADFLEEQGLPLGEFIRVQVELASLESIRIVNDDGEVCGWKRKKDRDQHYRLRRRERELLEGNFCNWVPLAWHQGSGVSIRMAEAGPTVEFTGSFLQSATFERGMIVEVTCRIGDFWRECERCRGTGEIDLMDRYGANRGGTYPACHGTGNVGHGPAIVRAAPVEMVNVTDREPQGYPYSANERRYAWHCHPLANSSHLPRVVFDLMDNYVGHDPNGPIRMKAYPTESAARLALSTALIQWAKSARVPEAEHVS